MSGRKATKSEVVEGGKSSNTTSKGGSTNYSSTKKLQQLKVEKKLDLDEIAVACLEIEQEMAKQESRPKNRRKQEAKLKNGLEKKLARENKNTSKVNKKEVEEEQGEGVQQLSEINMTGESSAEATRLTELIRISVEVLLTHLDQFGACVIDDFLGEERGNQVLKDVQNFKNLKEGELASGKDPGSKRQRSIRSDQIAWTDGIDPPCPGISHLMRVLDSIVLTANRRNDGILSKNQISGRTNAMVACYPGAGSHYVTHVDNPNRDGRCITAIYYLNKDWDTTIDGGALKLYSKYGEGPVAEVEPIFDRMIFFWSDRRNPHEVLPANRDRYAVTVWYMDRDERLEYVERVRTNKENIGATL